MTEGMTKDFVLAVAYCLAYDHWRQLPDRRRLERLRQGGEPQTADESTLKQMLDAARLALEDPSPREGDFTYLERVQDASASLKLPHITLVMGGATKIKQYVFESARLSEIRGASAILDHTNLVDLPSLFNQLPADSKQDFRLHEVREQFARRYGK